MKSIQKVEKVKNLLQEALGGLTKASSEWAENPLTFTSKEELENLYRNLEKMKDSLDKNTPIEIPGLWRIVTDTWPYTNKLRQKIVEAELAYERLYG